LFQNRLGIEAVAVLWEKLAPAMDVEWIDLKTHETAMSALLAGSKSGPSLVDCVGFEVIRARRIESVLVFDKHFESRGLRRFSA